MPIKSKKTSTHKIATKPPVKKFIVEEKTEEIKKTDEPKLDIKEAAPKTEDEALAEDKTLKTPISSEVTTPDLPTLTPQPEKEEGSVLKTEEEKDTLPSSNVTSFSLLESDKKPLNDLPMQENNKDVSLNPPSSAENVDVPVKSSQDEVNKWIENYDEKEGVEKKKGSGFFKIFLIILIILSLLAVIAGGVYYYQKNISGKNSEEKTEKTSEPAKEIPTQTPVPTKEPEKAAEKVDYSKYTLQILNGSGIPGEAGKIKVLLASLKFKSVITGNAANYDFKKTVIAIKKDLPDQIYNDITKAIQSTYDVEKEIQTLEATSKYDVTVTVGQKI